MDITCPFHHDTEKYGGIYKYLVLSKILITKKDNVNFAVPFDKLRAKNNAKGVNDNGCNFTVFILNEERNDPLGQASLYLRYPKGPLKIPWFFFKEFTPL